MLSVSEGGQRQRATSLRGKDAEFLPFLSPSDRGEKHRGEDTSEAGIENTRAQGRIPRSCHTEKKERERVCVSV